MLTAINKQKLLNRILTNLKRDLDLTEPAPRPVLEQLLFAVCREGVSRDLAERAFQNLRTQFYDWNEIRVSSVREVADALKGLPEAEGRALRIVSLLQQVFESTYSFDLESLHKKGVKQAEKQLERYEGTNAYIVASTVQLGLDGHALPIDRPMQRVLQRLELLDNEPAADGSPTTLEHQVPKARGVLFCEAISALAQQYCWEQSPSCPACPMRDLCPTGQTNQRPSASRKPKPR